jgi:hypothetical protein
MNSIAEQVWKNKIYFSKHHKKTPAFAEVS